MYLTQSLRRAVQQTPHATASIYNGRKRSFAQLGDRVARFAGALQAAAQAQLRHGVQVRQRLVESYRELMNMQL